MGHVLEQVECEPHCYEARIAWCTRLAPCVHPAREHQAGASLLREVPSEGRVDHACADEA